MSPPEKPRSWQAGVYGAPDRVEARAHIEQKRMEGRGPLDNLPDVRDGLTRLERLVLWQLHEAQRAFGDRNVPTAYLYGRVTEYMNIRVDELQRVLQRLIGVK